MIKKYCREIFYRCIIPIAIFCGSWTFAMWVANLLIKIMN